LRGEVDASERSEGASGEGGVAALRRSVLARVGALDGASPRSDEDRFEDDAVLVERDQRLVAVR